MHPLKQALRKKGVTARELSRRLVDAGNNTSESYLSQIIRGYRRPGIDTAKAIETAIGVNGLAAKMLVWEKPADGEAA